MIILVSWNWGGGAPGGTVAETKDHGAIEIKSKRGNTIKKKADPSNPAAHIERSGNDVVKRSSELTVEEKGNKAGTKRKPKNQSPQEDGDDGDVGDDDDDYKEKDEEDNDGDEADESAGEDEEPDEPHTKNKQGNEVKKGGKEANKKQKREQEEDADGVDGEDEDIDEIQDDTTQGDTNANDDDAAFDNDDGIDDSQGDKNDDDVESISDVDEEVHHEKPKPKTKVNGSAKGDAPTKQKKGSVSTRTSQAVE
ncbi:hypothetical protein M426DRAFT_324374 [Hypoxylon sp. CI-4A]|nr:hypothetical protein M426DRAFT_324374 [Hypoxylon sp. CI-4A]